MCIYKSVCVIWLATYPLGYIFMQPIKYNIWTLTTAWLPEGEH